MIKVTRTTLGTLVVKPSHLGADLFRFSATATELGGTFRAGAWFFPSPSSSVLGRLRADGFI